MFIQGRYTYLRVLYFLERDLGVYHISNKHLLQKPRERYRQKNTSPKSYTVPI